MKNIKKIFSVLCALAIVTTFLTPAFAVETKETVIDLGDGFYVVETVTQYPMTRAGDTVSGNKTAYLYQGSTLIGTTIMGATFDISGSTAKAIWANITGTGSNGWSYKSGSTSCSGNKVTGTATYQSGGTTKSHTFSMTCSPNGTIS